MHKETKAFLAWLLTYILTAGVPLLVIYLTVNITMIHVLPMFAILVIAYYIAEYVEKSILKT